MHNKNIHKTSFPAHHVLSSIHMSIYHIILKKLSISLLCIQKKQTIGMNKMWHNAFKVKLPLFYIQ